MRKTVWSIIAHVLMDVIRWFLRIPLLICFFIPTTFIILGLQENNLGSIASILIRTLFIGSPITSEGLSIHSGKELYVAMAVFLVMLELVSLLWEWLRKRFHIPWSNQKLAHLLLAVFWIGAFIALLATPHDGTASGWAMLLFTCYLISAVILNIYQGIETGITPRSTNHNK